MQSTADHLITKWDKVLNAPDVAQIDENYKQQVVAQLLENTDAALTEERTLNENVSVGQGGVANWDPILISLVRRAMPNLIAFDVAGVQAMSGPVGLIFAMKSRYDSMTGDEAFFDEANTDFSGAPAGRGTTHAGDPSSQGGTDTTPADGVEDAFGYGEAMDTVTGETLGQTGNEWGKMGFSIEKATATAKTRGLAADFTMELAQDLKAIHGLDAEAELSNILTTEILAEINRETIRTINVKAKAGAQTPNVATPGTFDLSTDADGRWAAEKFRGFLMQLEMEANAVAKDTRRGKATFILCSSNVASALSMSGVMDYSPALAKKLNVDDTGNTFAGTLHNGMKVYIDPYAVRDYATVGYRGSNPYDAGLFYCPYVPLTMVRAVDQDTFQPKIGFKTRYAMVANPFAEGSPSVPVSGTGANRANTYFRGFQVANILQ